MYLNNVPVGRPRRLTLKGLERILLCFGNIRAATALHHQIRPSAGALLPPAPADSDKS